jgi:ferric-dicitrate binding protein FerR (iron transport regulator)
MTLIEKYRKGICTDEETALFKGMIKAGELDVSEEKSMYSHWSSVNREVIGELDEKGERTLNRIHRSINLQSVKQSFAQRFMAISSKVAAILFIPLLVTLLYLFGSKEIASEPNMVSMTCSKGLTGRVVLPDGTSVWLNNGSTLSYYDSFEGEKFREVKIEGEAYFDVVTNPQQPFIVKTNHNLAVEVVGTSFNVESYDDNEEITVALIEGKVNLFEEKDGRKNILGDLNPNEVAVFSKENRKLNKQESTSVDKFTRWRAGEIVFVNEPLANVFNAMKRKYGVEIKVLDQKVLQRRITASFNEQSLDEFLKLLAIATNLEYEIIQGKSDEQKKVVIK